MTASGRELVLAGRRVLRGLTAVPRPQTVGGNRIELLQGGDALFPRMREAFERAEREIWLAADRETGEGLACNAGQAGCSLARRGSMTIVPVSAADEERRRRLLTDVVLPRWVQRCGQDCVTAWNAHLAPVFGIAARPD